MELYQWVNIINQLHDREYEKKTLESIVNYSKNLTIILITHGNQGLKYCNKIYKIKNGKLLKTN